MERVDSVAFVPLLNAGIPNLCDYEFSCGARIEATTSPRELAIAIESLAANGRVSPHEADAVALARGFLWARASLPKGGTWDVPEGLLRLALRLRNVLWCIYCHPHGENSYWRGGNLIAECAVYLHTAGGGCFDHPHRFPFMYGIANGEQASMVGWSKDLLDNADSLMVKIESYQRRVPRIYLAGHLQRMMASVDVRQFAAARLQLAVTALETFYIGDSPIRAYLWDTPIADRVRQVCGESVSIKSSFFADLRDIRNDAVHRGGLSRTGGPDRRLAPVLTTTELILRETMKWSITNAPTLDTAFSADRWPAR